MDFYTDVYLRGTRCYVRGYEDGSDEPVEKVYDAPLTFYAEQGRGASTFKNLEGMPLYPVDFDSIKEARQFAQSTPLYGNLKVEYTLLNELYPGVLKPDISKIRIGVIDIETECENGFPEVNDPIEKVNCVSIVTDKMIYTLSTICDYAEDGVQFKFCEDEMTLFRELKRLFAMLKLDVLTGWFSDGFDLPYIVARSVKLYGDMSWAKALSPWGFVNEQEQELRGKKQKSYEIVGLSNIDYLDIYKLYGKKQASYKLDHVARAELNDEKVPYTGTFKDFYTKPENHKLFIKYNIHDARLVWKLHKKLNYLGVIFMLAYNAKVRYRDTFMQIRMWESMIYNELQSEYGVIAPCKISSGSKTEKFEGAFVADPIPGLYEWAASFDVKSLYPSLIMMLNISPETLVGYDNLQLADFVAGKFDSAALHTNNQCIAANGARFSNEKIGFIPKMVEKLFDGRDVIKSEMFEVERLQQRIKNELKRRA